jgi:hypothetical protein
MSIAGPAGFIPGFIPVEEPLAELHACLPFVALTGSGKETP